MLYRRNLLFVFVFMLTMLASAWDAWDDLAHHGASVHLTLNVLLTMASFVGLLTVWQQLQRQSAELALAKASLTLAQDSLGKKETQTAKLMGELSTIIHHQFDVWKLSESEKEVALLLLKGLSLEEIAAIRGRAEKTVRQQASAIYSKAGIAGRHALSAYFFEDLLGK